MPTVDKSDLNLWFRRTCQRVDKARSAAHMMDIADRRLSEVDQVRLDHVTALLEIVRDTLLDIGSAGKLEKGGR